MLDVAIVAVPIVGAISVAADLSGYFRSLSALLGGGVRLSAALPIVARGIQNSALKAKLEAAHLDVVGGRALAKSLAAHCNLPTDALVLVRTGEKTGRLPETLDKAADLLAQRVKVKLETIAALAGPVLTVGIGAVAGTIVYAMFSTILGINELAFQ